MNGLSICLDLAMEPEEAFRLLVDELGLALGAHGMKLDGGPGGAVSEGTSTVGRIEEWSPGHRISLVWHPKSWEEGVSSRIVMSFENRDRGTRDTTQIPDLGRVVDDEEGELLGWYVGEVVAPLFSAVAPKRLGDWITDRRARSPSGGRSRGYYGAPIYHWPNFLAILGVLSLGRNDYLLEVGCGGGALLHEALKSGCRAAAIDHSADMVRLARAANQDAIATGRLTINEADATNLPFPRNVFTCAVMTGVIALLPDPLKALKEINRTLDTGGRLVVFTGSKEQRGTPAAPEPMASRLNFYEDEELVDLATKAGFGEARVEHPSLYEFAQRAGVPAADLQLFAGTSSSQLLIARKTT